MSPRQTQRWRYKISSDPAADNYFGACPRCKENDGFYNVGPDHWSFCREHKVKWCIGSNLFSSWRDQTEDEQRRHYNANGFGTYETVEPFYFPELIPEPTAVVDYTPLVEDDDLVEDDEPAVPF
jgi:hypothetical protein